MTEYNQICIGPPKSCSPVHLQFLSISSIKVQNKCKYIKVYRSFIINYSINIYKQDITGMDLFWECLWVDDASLSSDLIHLVS